MFNAQKFRQYVKDILFPPFSERELITLVYLVVLLVSVAVISDPSLITNAVSLVKRTNFIDLIEPAIAGLVVLAVIWMVFSMAISRHKEDFETKKFAAYVFYAALSLISFVVLSRSFIFSFAALFFEPLLSGSFSLWILVNSLIIGFLFFRTVLTLSLTLIAGKLDQEHLLAARMTDEQMSRTKLVMLIVAATAIFLFLLQGNDRLVAVLLSYFYVTLLFDIYRKIFPQSDPAFIKNIKRIKLK